MRQLILLTAVLTGCQSAPSNTMQTHVSRPPALPVATPSVDPQRRLEEARFLDFATANLQASVAMARQALRESRHPRLAQFARALVEQHAQPLEQLQRLRREGYAEVPPTPAYQLEGPEIGPMMVPGGAESFESRWNETMLAQLRAAAVLCSRFAGRSEEAELKNVALRVARLQTDLLKRLEGLQLPVE